MATTPVPVKQSGPSPTVLTEPWQALRNEMDRLFDRFMGGFGPSLFTAPRSFDAGSTLVPPVDIVEDDKGFSLTAELSGLTEKDIDLSISGDTLTISAEKQEKQEEKQKNYYISERAYGRFHRMFGLPTTVDRNKIEASFSNGVLTIRMPKAADAAPRKVEVKAAA